MSILSILDTQTGEEILTEDILRLDHIDRTEIRRQTSEIDNKNIKPKYVCFMCQERIKFVGKLGSKKKLHFSHLANGNECIWRDDTENLSIETQRKMFERVRESKLHKQMKSYIGSMLGRDKEFSNVHIEKRYINKEDEHYKIPDVSADILIENHKVKVVFEIQLTSTYLDVIIEREQFYYKNGVILIWVFSDFSKDLSTTRMTEDDILVSNKKNVFILDEDAIKESDNQNILHLSNLHLKPIINSSTGNITTSWSRKKTCSIHDITLDPISGKAYVYNFEKERTSILFDNKKKNIFYKKEYFTVLKALSNSEMNNENKFLENMKSFKCIDEERILKLKKQEAVISYILEILFLGSNSSKKGIYYNRAYRNQKVGGNPPIQLLKQMFNTKENYIGLFLRAIDYYGKAEQYMKLDKKGTLLKSINSFKAKGYDTVPLDDTDILQWLFSELFYSVYIPKTVIR